MAVGIASGLGSTFGMAIEGTVGTFTTPTTWIPHNKADFSLKKKPVISQALRGNRFLLAQRRQVVSYTAAGAIDLDITDRQFGKLFQVGLGSTPVVTQQAATAAWLQSHTPGTIEGQSLSFQKGSPALPGGTIQALSYNGGKILDWGFSVQRDGLVKYTANVDAWNEVTATSYTAPAYLTGATAPNVFTFAQGSLLTGGAITASTAALSTTTGTAPAGVVSGFDIKFTNKYSTSRYPLGSQIKKEQISNAFADITGSIEIEFANLTDYYNAFAADTTVPFVFALTGPVAIASTFFPVLQVSVFAAKFEDAPINESGPDIIKVKVPFTAYDDGSGNTVQLQYQTRDVAV